MCGYPAWWLCTAGGARETTKDCGGAAVGVVWLVDVEAGALEVVVVVFAVVEAAAGVVEVVGAARVAMGTAAEEEGMCWGVRE